MVTIPFELVLATTTVAVPEATEACVMGEVEFPIPVVVLTRIFVATTVDPWESVVVVLSVPTVTGPNWGKLVVDMIG